MRLVKQKVNSRSMLSATRSNVKSHDEIQFIQESCRIVADVFRLLKEYIRPGVTTGELDRIAEDFIRSQGGESAFKGYGSHKNNLYQASLCTSIDDQVVHGIPSSRRLQEGQIISIDVGVRKNHFYGDGAWTFQVGKVSGDKVRLMRVAEESLYRGIEQVRAGNHVHDISAIIQSYAECAGFSVVRDLVGHGVGRELHEEPAIPNFGESGTGPILKSGMTLAIEPMVNFGSHSVRVDGDGWTVRTVDGSPSAHFEHTVLVTEGAPEILTL